VALAAGRCTLGGLSWGEALEALPSAKEEKENISCLLLP